MQIRASLAAVLALVGFLTLVASSGVKEAKRGAESRRAGLVKLIHTRQSEVDSLGKELVRLRADVTSARRRLSATSAAGAEAVGVNGQRLVATSPIRAAGETITVNFRPLVPPYKVEAIGADRKPFERSAVAQRFKQWVADYGLGFSVRPRSQ